MRVETRIGQLVNNDKSTMADFKTTFIEKAIDSGVLLFGDFTLKSGR